VSPVTGGELLRVMDKAKGGGDTTKPKEHRSPNGSAAKTLEQLGISDRARQYLSVFPP